MLVVLIRLVAPIMHSGTAMTCFSLKQPEIVASVDLLSTSSSRGSSMVCDDARACHASRRKTEIQADRPFSEGRRQVDAKSMVALSNPLQRAHPFYLQVFRHFRSVGGHESILNALAWVDGWTHH